MCQPWLGVSQFPWGPDGEGGVIVYVFLPASPEGTGVSWHTLSQAPLQVDAAHLARNLLFFMSLDFS